MFLSPLLQRSDFLLMRHSAVARYCIIDGGGATCGRALGIGHQVWPHTEHRPTRKSPSEEMFVVATLLVPLLVPPPQQAGMARRALLQQAAAAAAAVSLPAVSNAAEAEENIEVYFGCGCFW